MITMADTITDVEFVSKFGIISDDIDEELFITTVSRLLSCKDDRFIAFLVHSRKIDQVYAKLRTIMTNASKEVDAKVLQLVILLTKLMSHNVSRTTSFGNSSVLDFFTQLRTTKDGYLKTLVSAFIVSYVAWRNTEATSRNFAIRFFQQLHNLLIDNKNVFSMFNEFLLLLAIHSQALIENSEARKHDLKTANEEELNKLLSAALGFKVQYGLRNTSYFDAAQLLLTYAVSEKDVVELASKISVTLQLNSHNSGYLPVHCIDYLLNNRLFSKFNISIEEWLQKQLMECCAPVHPVIVAIVRKYATSCVSMNKDDKPNKKIAERFFRDLFSRNILTENNIVPYLLSFYFIVVHNAAVIQAPAQPLISTAKAYSPDLISMIPVRHLVAVMDEHPENYQNIRTKIQLFTVENMFHMVPTIEDTLKKATNPIFGTYGISAEKILTTSDVMEIIRQLPNKPDRVKHLLNHLELLSAKQLAEFYQPIAMSLTKTLDTFDQSITKRFIELFDTIVTMVPQRLYVETMKFWFESADKHMKLAVVEHDFLVQEPARILRADPRVLQSPMHFPVLLNILEFYLKALRSHVKSVRTKYLAKTQNPDQAQIDYINSMKYSLEEAQCSLVVNLLLEIGDENINPCDSIVEIRRLSMVMIQKIFLTAPRVILTVHYQGYPLRYIPRMVEHVSSIYAIVDQMDKLICYRNIGRRIFAIYLVAHIVDNLTMPKHVQLAQMALQVIEAELLYLEPYEKIVFIFKVCPALEIIVRKLAFLRSHVISIIRRGIDISKCKSAMNPSLALSRMQPTQKVIQSCLETVQRIQAL